MRELNPRAWTPSFNRYATGFDDLYYHRQMNREGEWWCYPAGEDEPLNVEIELPTGLKDKNGREIYEGDIVTFMVERFNNATLGFESEDWHTAVVEWNQDDACYSFMVRDVPFSVRYEAEVIGNIHENKELLEAKDVD